MTDLETDFVLADARVDGTLHVVARGLEFAPPAGAIGANGNAGADPTDPLAAAAAPAALDLAAALLEDTAGVIELELPFAGSASSARAAAAAALNARLAALSETPFDALATLMAGEPGTAGSVPFQPGDTALNDRAQAAIRQLVTVLTERPRLVLRVHGGFDATADRNALARQQIQLHVQLATAIAASQQARAVDFSSSRAQDVLDEFARERLPAATVADLQAQFECEGAMIPLCRRAYYELVFDALVDSEAIAATTLTRLARFRALSITDALGAAGIASERLEVIMPGELADSPFGVGLKVELAAAAP
jgi:hypothetical protein